MTALTPIVNADAEAKIIHTLIVLAKKVNKKKRIELIKDFLENPNDTSEVKSFQQEVVHFLFSPLRTFNIKPKKDWADGVDNATKQWADAHALLLKLEKREVSGNAAKEAA